MNRIKELRDAAGLEQSELAERLGCTTQTVGRHERGERRLTIQWIQRYATALEVSPSDILGVPETVQASDVEPADVDGMPGLSAVSASLATRGIRLYRVVTSLVTDLGITTGQIITVDQSDPGRTTLVTGVAVVVRVAGTVLVLRQYVAPSTLITCARGSHNKLLRLDDRSVPVEIIGSVVLPDA